MKIFEYRKTFDKTTLKIFGFEVMVKTYAYVELNCYLVNKNILGNFITKRKFINHTKAYIERDLKILGISIVKSVSENYHKSYYIFNKKILNYSNKARLKKKFKKKYFKYFDKKHDDIYIFIANSGEVYLVCAYLINAILKKNESKNPLLVATKKYHVDIIKMLCPNIDYIYIDDFQLKINDDIFKIDNFRFFILFSYAHFSQVEIDIKTHKLGEIHYFKEILKLLKLSQNDIQMNKISVPLEDEKNMLEKVKKLGLNLENFVFLAPEAKSCELYDENFWVLLINKFQERGFDVFVNLTSDKINLYGASGYKKGNLNYAETFALAKKAKKIISLRSGLTDFLLQTNVPHYVLYTAFRYRIGYEILDTYQIISGFGLNQIPFIDKSKLQEFNTFELFQKDLLENILK